MNFFRSLSDLAWTFIAIAVAVLLFFGWLKLVHDPNVRKEADAKAVIDAKNDTIAVYRKAITGLFAAAKASDAAYMKRDTTIVRFAYVPQRTRDSLATLTAIVRAARDRGDTLVSIAVAQQLDDQVKACTARLDSVATELPLLRSDCQHRVAVRDSIIHDDSVISAAKDSQIAALGVLAHVAAARFSPFLSAKYGLISKRVVGEAGFAFRLFNHFSATAEVRHQFQTAPADTLPFSGKFNRSTDIYVGGTVTIH